jgi:hypothetical protein
LNAKRREIIAGDTSDDAMVASIVGGQATKSETEGKDIAKGSGLIAEIHKVRIRELLERVIARLL